MNTIFASMMTYWELDLTADDAEKQHEMQSFIKFLFCCDSERSEDKKTICRDRLFIIWEKKSYLAVTVRVVKGRKEE